jgi:hypothetical protein
MAQERSEHASERHYVVLPPEESDQMQAAVEGVAMQMSEPVQTEVTGTVAEQAEQVVSATVGEQSVAAPEAVSGVLGATEGAGMPALQPVTTMQPYWLNGEPTKEQLKAYYKSMRGLNLP